MKLLLKSAAFALLLCASSVAFGQSLVEGTVIFGNRFKPVPDVNVHLVNKSQKPPMDRILKTGSDGHYTFDDVPPGPSYAVAVYDATGKLVGTDASFTVLPNGDHVALPDLDISKGVLADRAVKAGGLIQNDVSVSPGANISNEQLRVLPLYNRTFLALGLIQPGVHDVPQGSPLQGAGFSIAGSQPTSTNFLLDGVDNVASSNNQAIPFQINEAVQEFRVIYAAPDMRYGQGSGGVVDVVTSRGNAANGGKAWHGSAFDYINNDALNAGSPLSVYSTSTFAKAAAAASDGAGDITSAANNNIISVPGVYTGYAPQRYNQLFNLLTPGSQVATNPAVSVGVMNAINGCTTTFCQAGSFNPSGILATRDSNTFPINSNQFGFSAGGPLLARNKLFLFVSYEGTYINNPTPIFERVPTSLDAPGVNNNDGAIARGVLGLFPAANVGQTGGAVQTGTGAGIFGFYRGFAPNYTHVNNLNFRPEVSLGHLGTVAFRYTGQLIDQLHDDTLPAGGAYPGNGANRKAQNQSAAITHNFPFGQSVNTMNIGFTQFRLDEEAQDRSFNGSTLGLPAGSLATYAVSGIDTRTTGSSPGIAGVMGGWYDSFWNACRNGSASGCAAQTVSPSPITPSLDGQFPLARIGAPLEAPSKHRDTEAFFSDLLSLHLGSRNTLMVGGDYRYQQNYSYDGGLARGLVVSNNIGEFSSDSETCVSCGAGIAFQHPSFDYELRQPVGYTGDLRSNSFGIFLEHKFQPTPQMTISVGARYQFFGEPLDTQNRLWNYNNTYQGLVRQGSLGTYDGFDYQCGGETATSLDSLYGNRRITFNGGWNCTPNGAFSLPNNNKDVMGHFGLSYAPDSKFHQVFRVAAGLYDDHLPAAYNEQLLHNRPNPFNVNNPSAIYGQNFYSAACGQTQTQCGFGLHTLNFAGLTPNDSATFQNYQAASGGNILYERDVNHLSTPYSMQVTASMQQTFGPSWAGEIAYVGSFNRQLPLIYDSNYANEFYCTQGGSSSSPNGVCNNTTFFPVFTESNIGSSSYHSVVLRIRSEQYHGLSMHAAFTLSKSLDDVAGSTFPRSTDSLFSQLFGRQLFGEGNPLAFALGANSLSNPNVQAARFNALAPTGTGQSPLALQIIQSANIPTFNPVTSALTTTGSRAVETSQYNIPQNPLAFSSNQNGGDYGRSDFDVRSRGVADFVYIPPFHWAKNFLLSGIFTAQSGQPFSIFSGPAYGQVTQRINATPSTIKTTGNPSGYFSGVGRANLASVSSGASCPSLYAQPTLYSRTSSPAACVGNSPRNGWSGPIYISQDLALQWTHKLGDRQTIILRAEGFNVFNRANYYNPISELSNDGVHINPEFGLIRSAHDPRVVQFAGRYQF